MGEGGKGGKGGGGVRWGVPDVDEGMEREGRERNRTGRERREKTEERKKEREDERGGGNGWLLRFTR